MESPLTLMATALSALLAGPFATEPSATLNLLPWHGQLMVPPDTSPTTQPACVHTAVKHLNWPAVGWVTTIFWSSKILPPPTGMSEVFAKPPPPPAGAPPSPVAPVAPASVSAGAGAAVSVPVSP